MRLIVRRTMSPLMLLLIFSLLLFSPLGGAAFEKPVLFDSVEEFKLDNGMLFLLLPRHEVPIISGRILVKVGNVDNQVGQTGLAHMFEHMAFKGTDRIGTRDHEAERVVQDSVAAVGRELSREISNRFDPDSTKIAKLSKEVERLSQAQIDLTIPMEFPRILEEYTFDFNATTSADFTNYIVTLPANHLEVWMLMESERFQYPSSREFYREIEVVKEERRMRTDDDPEGLAWELLLSLAFQGHPYRFPTIGYMSDLETLTQETAEAFREKFYVPSNAIGVLVGDFDPDDARRLIRDYFGDIPAGPAPPPVTTVDLPQMGIRRATVKKGTERQLLMAFPGVHPKSREARVAKLLANVLSRDRTSRLSYRLDIREKAVQYVDAYSNGGFKRYPGLFMIEVKPLSAFSNEKVEAMIWEELSRLQTDPVGDEKLDEIRSAIEKDYFFKLETNYSLARHLASAQAVYGDWRQSYLGFETMTDISAEEVTRFAAKLFLKDRASIVYLEPEDGDDGEGS